MSGVTGLHPEHLLEKESLGTLDDAERTQLDAHLAQCPACRFERTVRADFADELAGEDPPVRISGVLVDAGIEKQTQHAVVVVPPRRSRFRLTWLVAAAVLLLVATAVASEQTRHVILPFFGVRTVTVVVTAPAPTNPPPPPVVVNVLPQPQPQPQPTGAAVPTEEPKNEVVPVVAQQALADQHPDGPYAAHAQVRIEALSQK